jgi:hypothetical protein
MVTILLFIIVLFIFPIVAIVGGIGYLIGMVFGAPVAGFVLACVAWAVLCAVQPS